MYHIQNVWHHVQRLPNILELTINADYVQNICVIKLKLQF